MFKNNLTLFAACLIHICIGSVYAMSVLYDPIMNYTGWDISTLTTGFMLCILSLGFSAGITSRRVILKVKNTLDFALTAYTLGWILILISIGQYSEILFFLATLVMGVGIGNLYMIPVNSVTCQYKSPVKSGAVVMSFGIGSLIFAHVYGHFIDKFGLFDALIIVAVSQWLLIMIGTIWLKNKEFIGALSKDVIKDRRYLRLYFIFFLNVCIGIALLSNLVNFSEEFGTLETPDAVMLVAIAGLLNGFGRIFWVWVGKHNLFAMLTFVLTLQACAISAMLIFAYNPFVWCVSVLTIISIYGAGFAMLPSLCRMISEEKGSAAYGTILTAWGLAGIAGPIILNHTGRIESLLVLCIIALVLSLFQKKEPA